MALTGQGAEHALHRARPAPLGGVLDPDGRVRDAAIKPEAPELVAGRAAERPSYVGVDARQRPQDGLRPLPLQQPEQVRARGPGPGPETGGAYGPPPGAPETRGAVGGMGENGGQR